MKNKTKQNKTKPTNKPTNNHLYKCKFLHQFFHEKLQFFEGFGITGKSQFCDSFFKYKSEKIK
jgi:hypothetical protein